MEFSLKRIDNGFIVNGDFGYFSSKDGDYISNMEVFAPSIQDALGLLAKRLDEVSKDIVDDDDDPEDSDDIELPF